MILRTSVPVFALLFQVPEYVNVFEQMEPGVLKSKSSLQFVLDESVPQSVIFNVEQTIR